MCSNVDPILDKNDKYKGFSFKFGSEFMGVGGALFRVKELGNHLHLKQGGIIDWGSLHTCKLIPWPKYN